MATNDHYSTDIDIDRTRDDSPHAEPIAFTSRADCRRLWPRGVKRGTVFITDGETRGTIRALILANDRLVRMIDTKQALLGELVAGVADSFRDASKGTFSLKFDVGRFSRGTVPIPLPPPPPPPGHPIALLIQSQSAVEHLHTEQVSHLMEKQLAPGRLTSRIRRAHAIASRAAREG